MATPVVPISVKTAVSEDVVAKTGIISGDLTKDLAKVEDRAELILKSEGNPISFAANSPGQLIMCQQFNKPAIIARFPDAEPFFKIYAYWRVKAFIINNSLLNNASELCSTATIRWIPLASYTPISYASNEQSIYGRSRETQKWHMLEPFAATYKFNEGTHPWMDSAAPSNSWKYTSMTDGTVAQRGFGPWCMWLSGKPSSAQNLVMSQDVQMVLEFKCRILDSTEEVKKATISTTPQYMSENTTGTVVNGVMNMTTMANYIGTANIDTAGQFTFDLTAPATVWLAQNSTDPEEDWQKFETDVATGDFIIKSATTVSLNWTFKPDSTISIDVPVVTRVEFSDEDDEITGTLIFPNATTSANGMISQTKNNKTLALKHLSRRQIQLLKNHQ